MAALNQKRFTLALDDTIEELRTTDSIQRSSWSTKAAWVFSSISSTAESSNAIATDFDAQFISVWIKTKFHITQSDNDMRAQEQNLLNKFNYCQVSFNFEELQVFKTSHSKCEAYYASSRPYNRERFRLRLNDEF